MKMGVVMKKLQILSMVVLAMYSSFGFTAEFAGDHVGDFHRQRYENAKSDMKLRHQREMESLIRKKQDASDQRWEDFHKAVTSNRQSMVKDKPQPIMVEGFDLTTRQGIEGYKAKSRKLISSSMSDGTEQSLDTQQLKAAHNLQDWQLYQEHYPKAYEEAIARHQAASVAPASASAGVASGLARRMAMNTGI